MMIKKEKKNSKGRADTFGTIGFKTVCMSAKFSITTGLEKYLLKECGRKIILNKRQNKLDFRFDLFS